MEGSSSSIHRGFENMFPGVKKEEDSFLKNALSDGVFAAEKTRLIGSRELKTMTLKKLLMLFVIQVEDAKTGEKNFYYPEKDENGNTIVDKENSIIRFKNKKTGEIIEKKYVE